VSGRYVNEEDKVLAPWSEEQAAALRKYQSLTYVHELTCPNGHGPMRVEREGLFCPVCDYVQTWVPWVCISFGYWALHPLDPDEWSAP
jgi:hypothetical protein